MFSTMAAVQFITPVASSSACRQLKFIGIRTRLASPGARVGTGLVKVRRVGAGRPIIRSCSSSSSGGEALPLPTPVPEPKKGAWSETLGRLYGSQAPSSLSDIVWPSLGRLGSLFVDREIRRADDWDQN